MRYIEVLNPLLGAAVLVALIVTVGVLRLERLVRVKHNRLASLDGLRGFLALSVFLHHFAISYQYKHTGAWTPPQSGFYNVLGGGGVTLFFMITGFLFFGKIKAVRGAIDLNRFYLGRIFRIVPVYAVSVLVIYLIVAWETGLPFHQPTEQSLDGWLFFQATPINDFGFSPLINAGVVWTLSYEWAFYFCIPVIAFAWRRIDLQSWAILLLAILSLYFVRNASVIPYLGLNTLLLAPFALGGLASEISRLAVARTVAAGPWGAMVSIAALATLLLGFNSAYSVSAYLLLFAFFTPVALGNSLFGLLRLRSVIFLGEISYDIYLFHGIVLFAVFSILMPDALDHAGTDGRLLSLMLIAGAGVLVVSTLVHLGVERPMLRLGGRIAPIDKLQHLAAP